MYQYKRQIFLRETDASGVLLFSEQLNLALEALESYFLERGFSLQSLFEGGDYTLPVVHAETDFFAPLRVGDRVAIELRLHKKGTSSFTIAGVIRDEKRNETGKTQVTHVCVSKETGRSMPLPEALLRHLTEL